MGKRKLSDEEYDTVRMEALHDLVDRVCEAHPTFLCTPNAQEMTIQRNAFGQWHARIGESWMISSPDPYIPPEDAEWEVWARPAAGKWEKQGDGT